MLPTFQKIKGPGKLEELLFAGLFGPLSELGGFEGSFPPSAHRAAFLCLFGYFRAVEKLRRREIKFLATVRAVSSFRIRRYILRPFVSYISNRGG